MAASLDTQQSWLANSAGVYAPPDRVVHVQGDDARSWLSGQVTNDLRTLTPEQAVYTLAVTVKGRVLTDAWVREAPSGLALILPASHLEAALASFDKHIIMEDVELSVDARRRVLSVQGPHAAEVLTRAGLGDQAYVAARLGDVGFDLGCDEAEFEALRARLCGAAQELGGGEISDDGWAHAHVVFAVPRCGVDFGEHTYPQEAGLKQRAVSFNKGCYLGQEVICMLENRGQLARRLVQLEAPGAAQAEPGTPLMEEDGKRVGELTSTAVLAGPPTRTLALGYLKRPVAEVGRNVRAAEHDWRVRAVVGLEAPPE